MTSRQKITIVAFAIVVLIIIWQIAGLVGGGSTPKSTQTVTKTVTKPPIQMTATSPAAGASAAPGAVASPPPGAPPGTAGQAQPQMQAVPQPILRQAPVNLNPQIAELQKQTEQKYVDQINQLQTLRVQREIAETNQAIASAKLATVTAEKSVSDLLTKPTQPQYPTFPTGPVVGPAPTTSTEIALTPPPVAPIEIAAYTVVSVSMELGRWNAVLGLQGKMYNVSIGDVLPVDGSVVTSINKNGVVLTKDGKRRKISILSAI